MLFAILCTDKPNSLDLRLATRSAHLEYLKQHEDIFVIVGPTLADDGVSMNGSCQIVDVPDRARLDEYLANDPYSRAGLFEKIEIRGFKKVYG
ncbi:hypothetical protein FACS1894205_2780 [Alphaproteobacteria bacterium]|nr:hypothetical protein FACS1894205_2780 [Alphaproteobacteria bacterium]